MKKLTQLCLLLLCVVSFVVQATATLVPPFTASPGITPPTVNSVPVGMKVATTGNIPFNFGTAKSPHKNTGTVTETVYEDTAHHDYLFFVFQIVVTGGTLGDIDRLTIGDWDNSVYIDATQYAPGADKKALGVDRNGLGTVGINWVPLLTKGQTSAFVILYTHSTKFEAGTIGLIDTGSSPSLPGYVALPAPEPSALSFLLFAVPCWLCRRRSHSRRITD